MSWTIEESGRAFFYRVSGGNSICCETARPQAGISVWRPASLDSFGPVVRLLPSEGQSFPPLDECYVRGNDLVCRYPQREQDLFGLEVCYRLVPLDDQDGVAIETICSIQTNLLDCHPTCDVSSGCTLVNTIDELVDDLGEGKMPSPHAVSLGNGGSPSTPPSITKLNFHNVTGPQNMEVHLILPPSDRAAAATVKENFENDSMRYRLLAEFLEKGVIRKARFWTVLWKVSPTEQQIRASYRQLLNEPLPLTP